MLNFTDIFINSVLITELADVTCSSNYYNGIIFIIRTSTKLLVLSEEMTGDVMIKSITGNAMT